MNDWEIVLGIVIGLAVNECTEISPWCAERLVQVAARLRYASPDRRQVRRDELVALIAARPGKLLKLLTALCFLASAIPVRLRQTTAKRLTWVWSVLNFGGPVVAAVGTFTSSSLLLGIGFGGFALALSVQLVRLAHAYRDLVVAKRKLAAARLLRDILRSSDQG